MSNLIGTNDIKNELGKNFIEYAVACNTDRAIPDAYSGLKPVAKRILWSMYENGRTSNKAHVKAARIVGDVMGQYHPHGDSSIYGAMVRLSQNWVMRYPLVDWHGSNGNISGDGAAAMRYTEARLSKLSEDGLLNGIKKKNVDFIPSYDELAEEPITLPSIFPNLLCNPNSGIGVAMACNWLPHNLKEVADAIKAYATDEEPMLPGPDFPTGGIIINKNDIPMIMKTGHGSVKIRGRYKIEKNAIIFYELPYGTTVEGLLEEISQVCEKQEIEGIDSIADETNKNGIRLVIDCKKDANPESIVQKLFAKTNLQTSASYNQIALINKTPTELNLKDCCKIYIEHNTECLRKETEFDLAKAEARLNIVCGLLIALEDIDNVIAMIKASENSTVAKEKLMAAYQLNEEQAKSILAMRLSSLAKLEKLELEQEKKELIDNINDMKLLLNSVVLMRKKVIERLDAVVKKYGDERRTLLEQIEIPKEEKEIVEVIPEDVVVVTTQTGYVKKIPSASFKVQRKGGKGVKTSDEAVLDIVRTNTVDSLIVFTSAGKMYKILVDDIPTGANVSKGVPIRDLAKLDKDESVVAVTTLHRKSTPQFVIFVTKNGVVKKTYLEEYMKIKRGVGIVAINLRDGDSIVDVSFMDKEDLVLVTKKGMTIKFSTETLTPIGRTALGVRGINLAEGDEIVRGLPVHKTTDQLGIFLANGMAKKCNLSDFPVQARGGKGLVVSKAENSEVISAEMISDEDNILLNGKTSIICISAKDIPLTSRTAQGSIAIKSDLVSVTKL